MVWDSGFSQSEVHGGTGMGLRYSYNLVLARQNVDRLLTSMADRLSSEDRGRLLHALPWSPGSECERHWAGPGLALDAQGIANLAPKKSFEQRNDYCFSFAFAADPALRAYAEKNDVPLHGETAHIGCIWVKLEAGRELAWLSATSATSDMSRLFTSSESIRACWLSMAGSCGARTLILDTEDDWKVLLPSQRSLPVPIDENLQPFTFIDDYRVNVDAFYAHLLRSLSCG